MSRRSKALEEIGERVEVIYEVCETPNFVEVKGEIGGDLVCYRVYFDDSDNVDYVCER